MSLRVLSRGKVGNTATTKRSKFFYGYVILAASFLLMVITNGVGYGFSLYVDSLQTEFGWNRADIMLALVINSLVSAGISPLIGHIVDRFGAKNLLIIGAIVFGISVILLGLISSLWQFDILWGIIGMANAGVGFIPTTVIIFNWFKRRRGLAVGVMGAGIGAGGFIVAPIIGILLEIFGWRVTYFVLGATALLVLLPLALFVFKTKPSEMGLNADGVADSEVGKDDEKNNDARTGYKAARIPDGGLTLKQSMGTAAFWIGLVMFTFYGVAQNAIFQNHAPFLMDAGFAPSVAAFAVSICGFGSMFRFALGMLADWIGPKYVLIIGVVLQMAGTLILMTINANSSMFFIFSYAIILGLGVGCWVPSLSMIPSATFGMVDYALIFSIYLAAFNLGGAFGLYGAGLIYDITGGYHLAFIIVLTLFVTVIPLALLNRRPKWD